MRFEDSSGFDSQTSIPPFFVQQKAIYFAEFETSIGITWLPQLIFDGQQDKSEIARNRISQLGEGCQPSESGENDDTDRRPVATPLERRDWKEIGKSIGPNREQCYRNGDVVKTDSSGRSFVQRTKNNQLVDIWFEDSDGAKAIMEYARKEADPEKKLFMLKSIVDCDRPGITDRDRLTALEEIKKMALDEKLENMDLKVDENNTRSDPSCILEKLALEIFGSSPDASRRETLLDKVVVDGTFTYFDLQQDSALQDLAGADGAVAGFRMRSDGSYELAIFASSSEVSEKTPCAKVLVTYKTEGDTNSQSKEVFGSDEKLCLSVETIYDATTGQMIFEVSQGNTNQRAVFEGDCFCALDLRIDERLVAFSFDSDGNISDVHLRYLVPTTNS